METPPSGLTLDKQKGPPYKLCVRQNLCPGDSLVASAAIFSLHAAYPGEYLTDIDMTAGDELYLNNPDITKMDRSECHVETLHYDLIHQCNQRPIHFMDAQCDGLAKIIGRPVPLSTNRPVVVLSDEERQWVGRVQEIAGKPVPYALILSGGKLDFTTKHLGGTISQQVVDAFRGRLQFVQVGGQYDHHPPLNGVISQVGKTSIRELIRLAYHSSFGVGPTTLLQHIYAALRKPYICVIGGREPLAWVNYSTQRTVSSHGLLPCCAEAACWASRVRALNDGSEQDQRLCAYPMFVGPGMEAVPRCISMHGSTKIIEEINHLAFGGVIRNT